MSRRNHQKRLNVKASCNEAPLTSESGRSQIVIRPLSMEGTGLGKTTLGKGYQ
ncbi:uncharacterized protein METZ01_LOCUS413963 [marine metagenome]|uniref:Uncharacterized protein n=1 Tax=marine metagenome TaxID=408172 RepID=A0A382WR41_9ZZZZ